MFNNDDRSGGFNTTAGFDSPFRSSQSTEKKTKSKNFSPVLTATINNAEVGDDGIVRSDGLDIHHITFVGVILSVKSTPTRSDYIIDDHSSTPIEVRSFQEKPDESMKENCFVRIIGQVRGVSGKVNVIAFLIRPIVDANEITNHFMEFAYSKILLQRISQGDYCTGDDKKEAVGVSSDTNEEKLQDAILTVIRSKRQDDGLHVDTIIGYLKEYNKEDLKKTIQFLSTEGHIYCTIDDFHFQATDEGY